MNKLMMCGFILFVSNSFAGDIIILKHGVEFDHKGHQTEKVGMCTVCHDERIGKINGFGKDWAHKHCIGCHDIRNSGRPATCGGCHKTMGSIVPSQSS